MQNLSVYYAQRASEYESIYEKPERQEDLSILKEILNQSFTGKDVLEIACGTGYWTAHIAKSAKSILATDVNNETLEIARRKNYGSCPVTFLESDAFSLTNLQQKMTDAFHGFWWSHIPLQDIGKFLKLFHAKLKPEARVVMIDNIFVEGSSTPISRTDKFGNTYQQRLLGNGSTHEVLKNFTTPDLLHDLLRPYTGILQVSQLNYYWIAEYYVS